MSTSDKLKDKTRLTNDAKTFWLFNLKHNECDCSDLEI